MKAHKWATILLEENKTLMSTERQHTRAHTHNNKRKQNRIKRKKNVPMVLKMLYNWDDMHIFGFAFPEKPSAGSSPVFRWSLTYEQQMLKHKAASLSLHSFSVRFTFSHNAVGHQMSGVCAARRPLPRLSQHRSRSFYTDMTHGPFFPTQLALYLYLYINKYVEEKEELGNRMREETKSRLLNRPNCYNFIMQVWDGPETNRTLL